MTFSLFLTLLVTFLPPISTLAFMFIIIISIYIHTQIHVPLFPYYFLGKTITLIKSNSSLSLCQHPDKHSWRSIPVCFLGSFLTCDHEPQVGLSIAQQSLHICLAYLLSRSPVTVDEPSKASSSIVEQILCPLT